MHLKNIWIITMNHLGMHQVEGTVKKKTSNTGIKKTLS
jgi:hypothetical protein